ncbi:hypothetical protein AOR10_24440, partial [Vibrio alginolyticus]
MGAQSQPQGLAAVQGLADARDVDVAGAATPQHLGRRPEDFALHEAGHAGEGGVDVGDGVA